MPGPWAVKNLQIPHPRDSQGGQLPRSAVARGGGRGVLGAAGIDCCIMHMAGYFEVISFLILPVFNFLILFNKKKNKQKKGSWVILCYFHARTRLTYKVGWSRTRKLNFSILARQHFAGFYFRDFNRQIWTKDIKFRDSSVLNVTLMFVKSDHPYWPVRYKDMRKPPSNRIN